MTSRRSSHTLIALAALAVSACAQSSAPPPAASPSASRSGPRLVVLLVVDQLRADYLERHQAAFTGGLRRLLDEGAWFQNAAYPYLNTITCAGHSTIGTGALPYRHGMILNTWFDRTSNKSINCTDDAATTQISTSGATGEGDSARWLLSPTLADHLRERAGGRVVAMSLKARSAIGLVGHQADALVWYDDRGGFATSTAYGKDIAPALRRHVQSNPVAADFGRTWERLLPPDTYQGSDEGVGERPPTGWTRSFPHALGDKEGKPIPASAGHWTRSPYADDYLARMAIAAIDEMQLGKGRGTDFLGVSFSTLDLVGHAYGPASHEVQDITLRVDLAIGKLLDHLESRLGRDNYVLALTSDHGVAPIPEQVPGAGRRTSRDVAAAIDAALVPLFGEPKGAPPRAADAAAQPPPRPSYMAYSAYTDVYLAAGVLDRLRADPRALEAVRSSLTRVTGIAHVFTRDEIAAPGVRSSSDPVKRAAALNFYPERSGDLILVPQEYWIFSSSATTHGTLYPYDQRVPVILFGAGVSRGRFSQAATPADVAPTLGALAGMTMPNTDGRVLREAMAPASAAK